ncbi:MAG: hypothetical protein IT307_05325 [Chloroflexi bacterium]|nr:hypothetical protein [Chloroflexota bacterium]
MAQSIGPGRWRAVGPLAWLACLVLVLAVVGSLVRVVGAAAADDQSIAYVPRLPEMTELLGVNLPGYNVTPGKAEDGTWGLTADYLLAPTGVSARYELFVAASVLTSPTEAAQFFRDRAGGLETGNERMSVSAEPVVAQRYRLDELREYRLIYVGPSSGQRVSSYIRLARLGRSVTMVQAIGNPEADDRGAMDNDRALALARTFELVLGRMLWYPSDPAHATPGLDALAREWGRHGFTISVEPTGHGEASWRVYRWCKDNPNPPCDDMVGNQIVNGGWAKVLFYYVEGQTAEGVVIGSAASDVLALGPATLTLQPYGMARLEQAGRQIDLCGPDYPRLAPESVRRQSPCGA